MKNNILFFIIMILISQELVSQRISEATKYRQGLDSTVFQVWENNAWKRKGKYSYKYNTNEKLTSYAGYGLIEGVYTQTERGNFEYNTAGKTTLDVRESISEFATNIWIIDRKTIYKYDTSNRLLSTEIYGQYYDQSLGIIVTFGIEKTDFAYNTAGEIILYTYYEWDESIPGWIRSVKIETNTLNGLETLYASYQWDITYSTWIGTYKTEKSQLAGTGFINNTIYSWNLNTNNWYPRLKAEYLKGSDTKGITVTQNNYKLATGTTNLVNVSRSVFSSPITTGLVDANSFKLKENANWNNATNSWVVDTNTEISFNSNNLITGSVTKQNILKNSTSTWIKVDKTVMTNTIQDGKIIETKTDNYVYNQQNDINELNNSSKEILSYDSHGLNATKINMISDVTNPVWKNKSRTDYCYNTRLMQIGQVIYDWKDAGWKFISRTENDTDQIGNIVKDIDISFSEEFNQNIITRWIENEYDANMNLIKLINVKSTITKNAQTGKNELNTKGTKTSNTFINNQLISSVSSIFNASTNDFIDTEKTVNEYFPDYPTALKSETIYSFDAAGQNPAIKDKMVLTYNFSYPVNLLMLPFHTLIKGNPIQKYYKYQPVNALTSIWNSSNQTWSNKERTMMYFTSKTLTAIPGLPDSGLNLWFNQQTGKIMLSGNQETGQIKLIIYDLTGKEVLHQYLDDNGTTAYSNNIKGIHLYKLMLQNKCISKGKIIL